VLILLAWLPTAYLTFVIHAFASLPLASTQVHGITLVHAAGYYLVLFAFLALLARHRIAVLPPPAAVAPGRRPATLPAATAFAAVALSGVLVWLLLTAPGSNRLTVTFLDIGQGDAALVQAPNGSRILVDGGPSGEAISEALGRRLPFDDRRIDLLVLTHPQADHMGGLPDVLRRYHVRQLLDTRYAADTALYADWRHAVADTGVTEVAAQRGEAMNLGDGVTVTVLNPPGDMNVQGTDDLNDSSIVLRLTMGGVSMLLTGDITGQAESDMLASGTNLQASVLKVAHHGSQTSSSPDFLRAVHPAIDVISVGANNPFGHPAADVVNRLRDASVFRTDENGDVTVSTDGERIWVETQRTIVEP